MMFRRLDVLNAFFTYAIFNLRRVYREVSPLWTEEHLNMECIDTESISTHGQIHEIMRMKLETGEPALNYQRANQKLSNTPLMYTNYNESPCMWVSLLWAFSFCLLLPSTFFSLYSLLTFFHLFFLCSLIHSLSCVPVEEKNWGNNYYTYIIQLIRICALYIFRVLCIA